MSTSNNYSSEEQINGAPKGSANNPYTVSEYNEMLIDGTWKGGFVQGMGYVLQDVVVKGSKHTSNSSGFWGSLFDVWDSLCSSCSSLFGSDNEDYDTHPSYDGGVIDNTKKLLPTRFTNKTRNCATIFFG